MSRRLVVLSAWLMLQTSVALAQTPEVRANASTGRIPNPSTDEFYFGPISAGQNAAGEMFPRIGAYKGSLDWYKYESDGQTGVVFDTFGSVFGFGGGNVFGGGNTSELALFNASGTLVATTESVRAPSTGESNVPPIIPAGTTPPPLGAQAYRQPRDPRQPAVRYRNDPDANGWIGSNAQGLSQLSFVKNAQSNPVWNPTHPQHQANADWDEYPVLPAGTYFLAVVGYSTYFSTYPRDIQGITDFGDDYPFASGPVTPTTPFGFVTFTPHSGYYTLQARLPGDMTLDGSVNTLDRDALKAKILEFAPTRGLVASSFENGDLVNGRFMGLPANLANPATELQRFDLTGNSRIDIYDLFQFARWTEQPQPIVGDANLDEKVDFADLLILAQNYGRTDNPGWTYADFTLEGNVAFGDLLGLAQNYGFGTSPTGTFAGDWALAQTLVPEPTLAAGGVAIGATALRRRRSRRGGGH